MNKPIQAADVPTRSLSKVADAGNRQSSETESPFSALLGAPIAATPVATAVPGKAGTEDGKPAVTPVLSGLQIDAQAGIQVLAGVAVPAASLQAATVESLEAGIQLPPLEPARPGPVMQPAGAAPVGSKAVQLHEVTAREAARLLVEGTVPAGQAVQQAQIAGMARIQLARMPDGGVPQPVQVATEALARNAETAAAVDMSNADFSAAARKGTGAALVSRPDYSPAVRGERPGAELMQLIAGGRSLLPDGAGIAVQSQTPVNIPVTAEGVTDFSQTPSAIRGQIPTLVGQPGWDRAVGEQALWFVSQNIKVASLRLNPAHLGPMEMMVTMDGDEANVAFASSNAIVREALESAIPRLREMLSENGLNLGNVHVSHQGLSDQRGHRPHGSQLPVDGRTADTSPGDLHAEPAVPAGIRIPLGLVDYYA